jgi:hypothetical protein
MSRLLRMCRVSAAALLAAALVIGVNGFEGAIHSVHHLPAPVDAHAHNVTSDGHDEQQGSPVSGTPASGTPASGTPASGTEVPCSIAAAASQASATTVEPPVTPAPVATALGLVALGALDPVRTAWREPGSGRAPPSIRSASS